MTYIPALEDGAATLATGAPADIYSGRDIVVSRGHDIDVTKMRGYSRMPGHESMRRPGAHSPKVNRTPVSREGAWWVGTQNERDSLARMRRQWEEVGPVGTRHSYAIPPPAGLNRRSRMRMCETPAAGVFRSAMATTGGMMRLGGSFSAPYGSVPPNLRNPLPPGPAPVQGVGPGVAPVACLPGTPGCLPGAPVQMPWGQTQNHGQAQAMSAPPPSASPLPNSVNATTSPIELPVSHPGTQHVVNEQGTDSYVSEPSYPSYQSPFGYSGGNRVDAPRTAPSGSDSVNLAASDDPDVDGALRRNKALALGALVVAGGLFLIGRKRRRS